VSAKWLAAFVSIILCAGCVDRSLVQASEVPAPAVKLIVLSGEGTSAGLTLDLKLWYQGQQKIRISESSLPWRMQHSLLLLAVCLDGKNRVIQETYSLENPSPNTISLEPGQSLTGSVDLLERFPTLGECVANHEALVFWSFQLKPRESLALPRVNGGVSIAARPANRG
jgi:hypothetical protein